VPQIIADGVEDFRQFGPDGFGVEANQFQELLADLFDAKFRRQGMLGVHPWLIHNELNKLVRLRRLGPYLAARRLRLKADSPGKRLLLDQLRQFPTADHDDGHDALEMAIRLAGEHARRLPADLRHPGGAASRLGEVGGEQANQHLVLGTASWDRSQPQRPKGTQDLLLLEGLECT
jgi:hypothetical protein